MSLTNVRTFIQFSQYGDVVQVTVNANKLRAMNIVKSVYGVKSLTTLHEYQVENYLPIDQLTKDN